MPFNSKKTHVSPVSLKWPKKSGWFLILMFRDEFCILFRKTGACRQHIQPLLRVSEPFQERIRGDVTCKGTSLGVLQPMAWWKDFDVWVTLVEKKIQNTLIHSQKAIKKKIQGHTCCPKKSLTLAMVLRNFPIWPSQDLPFSEGQGTTNLTHLPP